MLMTTHKRGIYRLLLLSVISLLPSCSSTRENYDSLFLMNETSNNPSKMNITYDVCLEKTEEHPVFPSAFQKAYLKESLKWEILKTGYSLSWNDFAQFFIFSAPVKLEITTYFDNYSENEIRKIAQMIRKNSLNRKFGHTISLEKKSIKESFSADIPCVILVRRMLINSRTVVTSCSGKVFVSTIGVSDKNSAWIQEEVLRLYEPAKLSVSVKTK